MSAGSPMRPTGCFAVAAARRRWIVGEAERRLGERRQHPPRTDGVATHSLRPVVGRDRSGEGMHCTLRRVDRHVMVSDCAGNRADVDDRAAIVLVCHVPHRSPATVEDAAHVDIHHQVEVVVGGVLDRFLDLHTSVVDDHVKPPGCIDHRLDQCIDRGWVSDVGFDPGRTSHRRLDRAAANTVAPSATKRSAMLWPMPLDAPVTIAVRPARRPVTEVHRRQSPHTGAGRVRARRRLATGSS